MRAGDRNTLAITAAVSTCSRRGILVSDSHVLKLVGKANVELLDKTGTVTRGDLSVVDVAARAHAIPLVAALETYSEHLLGQAVVECAGAGIPAARDVKIAKRYRHIRSRRRSGGVCRQSPDGGGGRRRARFRN